VCEGLLARCDVGTASLKVSHSGTSDSGGMRDRSPPAAVSTAVRGHDAIINLATVIPSGRAATTRQGWNLDSRSGARSRPTSSKPPPMAAREP
jgi:hypothetical protein